jgi:hypothetical protein
MKTYMSFTPKLPRRRHENLHELQTQTSSWKLRWVSRPISSPTTWKLTWVSCPNFLHRRHEFQAQTSSPTTRKLSCVSILSFLMLRQSRIRTSASMWWQLRVFGGFMSSVRKFSHEAHRRKSSIENSCCRLCSRLCSRQSRFGFKLNLEQFQVVSVFMFSKWQHQEAPGNIP